MAERRFLAGWSPAVLVLIALLLLLILPPLYFLLKTSLYTTNADGSFGDFTLEYYRDMVSSPRFVSHFANSSLFAAGSAVLASGLGARGAGVVGAPAPPPPQYVFLMGVVSLGSPHVFYTVAWFLILGRAGPVNMVLMGLFGLEAPPFSVNSLWGMILIEG